MRYLVVKVPDDGRPSPIDNGREAMWLDGVSQSSLEKTLGKVAPLQGERWHVTPEGTAKKFARTSLTWAGLIREARANA